MKFHLRPEMEASQPILATLHASIARGIADVDAGRVKPAAQVFDSLEKRYRAMLEAKGK
jgi:antitoxin ParD1/3/4